MKARLYSQKALDSAIGYLLLGYLRNDLSRVNVEDPPQTSEGGPLTVWHTAASYEHAINLSLRRVAACGFCSHVGHRRTS